MKISAIFKVANNCDRIVVLWAASTEIYVPVDEKIHGTLAALEQAMKDDDKAHIATVYVLCLCCTVGRMSFHYGST